MRNSSLAISYPKRRCCWSAALSMPENLENSAVATGLEKSVFISIPKKAMPKNVQSTTQLYSCHTLAKYYSKFSKPGFNGTWTVKFQMFKLDLEKAEEPEIKLPTSVGSLKKQESSRKTSFALLTMLKPLTVWITTNRKILQEIGIPGHLTCLLKNLYAGQEAIARKDLKKRSIKDRPNPNRY